ncbi:MAG: histidine kinase dimerization/phospho-acceptor domain-containing protein [Novosphingobium sp.]
MVPVAASGTTDDRLAVLLAEPTPVRSEASAHYRQIVDLLDQGPRRAAIPAAALGRLEALEAMLLAPQRAAILRDRPQGLRRTALLVRLAGQEVEVAETVLAEARLDDDEWDEVIPHLSPAARALLLQIIRPRLDRTAPSLPGDAADAGRDLAPAPTVRPIGTPHRTSVEAASPRVPATGVAVTRFASDARGRIVRSDRTVAPMLAEMPFGARDPLAPGRCDRATADAIREHRAVVAGRIEFDGAPAVAGAWRVDATPRFEPGSGRFLGYWGVLRRETGATARPADDAADGARQLLHELRTPIGAILGFAEVIQQQLFGPAPSRYRDLAAGIAGESSAILARLAQLEELARPEGGAAPTRPGSR